MAFPEQKLYKTQDWEAQAKQQKFGTTELNARQKRRFNRWQNKDAQVQDRLAFDKGEQNKLLNSMDAAKDTQVARIRATYANQKPKAAPKPTVIPKTEDDQGGNMGNGGGNNPYTGSDIISRASSIKVNIPTISISSKTDNIVGAPTRMFRSTPNKRTQTPTLPAVNDSTPSATKDSLVFKQPVDSTKVSTPIYSDVIDPSIIQESSFVTRDNMKRQLPVTVEGKRYPTFGFTGVPKKYNWLDNKYAAYDPTTGLMRMLTINNQGKFSDTWADDTKWADPTYFMGEEGYNQFKAEFKKQGGIMNRVNYFQQGGVAPQQQPSMEDQVIALVQAAMQGDQQATQTIEQIMQAAQSGDQKATQIAQMIQQVMQQMQGQATSAKWGAKLGYIRSLKYAKGGKTCPDCEKKKVKVEACGGKAKKRYFGGLV